MKEEANSSHVLTAGHRRQKHIIITLQPPYATRVSPPRLRLSHPVVEPPDTTTPPEMPDLLAERSHVRSGPTKVTTLADWERKHGDATALAKGVVNNCPLCSETRTLEGSQVGKWAPGVFTKADFCRTAAALCWS